MKIDVKHIAELARLRFSEEEFMQLEADMISLAGMIKELPNCDAQGSYNEQRVMELRPDAPEKERFSADEILRIAPDVKSGCFVVPKAVE